MIFMVCSLTKKCLLMKKIYSKAVRSYIYLIGVKLFYILCYNLMLLSVVGGRKGSVLEFSSFRTSNNVVGIPFLLIIMQNIGIALLIITRFFGMRQIQRTWSSVVATKSN